jgi:hypothetical protein
MRNRVPRHREAEEGAYAAVFVLVLAALIAAGALAVDMGTLYFARHSTKAVADMASTAGGLGLEPTTGGTPLKACQDAWEYAIANLPDAPAASSPCNAFASPPACGPSTAPITATGTSGPYTISITWPVPDSDARMDSRLTPTIDGDQCQRVGVVIQRDNDLLLAGFGDGPDRMTVGNGSVARAQASQTQGDLVALVVLDRTGCQVLESDGGGSGPPGGVIVEAAEIEDDQGNPVSVPGAITVDSDGRTCGANRYAIQPSNSTNTRMIAEGTLDGVKGVILSHALFGDFPEKSHNPNRCSDDYSMPTSSRPLQPCPVGGDRVTRAPIDHRYNCKATYPGVTPPIAGCSQAAVNSGGDYIDQLLDAFEGFSAENIPTSGAFISGDFKVYPDEYEGETPTDPCRFNSATSVDLGTGNWFIDCPNEANGQQPGFRMSNIGASFTAGPGEIVFAGGVSLGGGEFAVGSTEESSIVYIRSYSSNRPGNLESSQGSRVSLQNTFVFIQDGGIDLQAGSSGDALYWIAPDDEDFPFDDLVLWSESVVVHRIGAGAVLDLEGTFFMPNAQFRYTGSGSQEQARAQFVAWRLYFGGQGSLVMTPHPDRSTMIPIQGVTLIR